VIDTVDGNARSYEDTTIEQSVTYCYVITALFAPSCAGPPTIESAPSNEICLSTCPEPPCDQPTISGWLFTDEGFIAGNQNGAFRTYNDPASVTASPWSFPSSSGTLKVRMDYEDDANCTSPPFNGNIQIATAEAVITVASNCPTRMTVDWRGRVEQQNSGYERMWLYLDGNLIDYAESTQGLRDCFPMLPVTGSAEAVVQPGSHLLRIETDTGTDGQHHFDAYYEFDVTFEPE